MIEQTLQTAVSDALKQLYNIDIPSSEVVLQNTKKEFEGDFTVVVFPYVKQARKSPEMVGQEIGEVVTRTTDDVESFNVIKGFLNFKIADAYWLNFLLKMYSDKGYAMRYAKENDPAVVVEFSSPNTNKPLHLGHIRNNLLGWSVSQLLSVTGNNVKRVNLVNDRGIHICKSMLAWQLYGNGETPASSGMKGDHLVGKYYVEFDKHYKEEVATLMKEGLDEEAAKDQAPLMQQARAMLKRWEENDSEVRDLWNKMNGWVYEGFDETYHKLGISFDKVYYESQTYLLGKELVSKGLDSGVLFRKEDGSVWCDLTNDGLDQKLLLRRDGTSVYMTQDLGTAVLRHNDFHADRLVYVVGNEQDYHFKVLKIVMQRLGFEWAEKIYHLSYGMVELPNGKMKSREGTVVDADDLISEMVKTAADMCSEHSNQDNMSDEERNRLYHMLAMGALKYFILKVDPSKNMLFNPEESIDFNGNTGPFIQYTHARAHSIITRATERGITVSETEPIESDINAFSLTDKERDILKVLHSLPGLMLQASAAYSPAMVANYAYDLAKTFNSFYQDTPILRETNASLVRMRIMLCKAVETTIKNTMAVLGIEVPERM